MGYAGGKDEGTGNTEMTNLRCRLTCWSGDIKYIEGLTAPHEVQDDERVVATERA